MKRQRKGRWIGAALLIAVIMATALSANADGGRIGAMTKVVASSK
jgi:hypothetical protein